ncbi:hypothetical protein A2Y85_01015 [candidate division WOR-3 bacterium RBG_13_43_14]|uniref:Secretion system C-terminal sorting domain-containing protein n=1 Tax=candidate division WOR-3 bacterium RBG_13_43_14 TaxID=1802590 RepID=A0A1F4UAL1_UNCW3|nr:MAG: hypothetical protein A2Y85_01015 [candidate division WOR-3 bacterium RBG_13_43_14]
MLHIIWKDGRAGNDEIYYKRNLTGNPAVYEVPGYVSGIAFSVKPTLFTDGLSIEFSRPLAAPFWITLQDVLGRPIIRYESGPVSAGVQLCGNRIATLPAGVYILTMESQGKTIGYCKIVKVK